MSAPADHRADLHEVDLVVNGQPRRVVVESRRTLAEVLREDLRLTGTHLGCEHGVCGACTVAVDGQPARSCLLLALQVAGSSVETVESLEGADGELGLIQQAMRDEHAFQCAYCAPGFLMSIACLLAEDPDPSPEKVKEELSGNLCRCTGYASILQGVERAAAALRERSGAAHGTEEAPGA